MSQTGLDVFDTTVHKTNAWLNDLMQMLDWSDRHKAYRALRATIHALRDRLPVVEVAHLGAQFPMLIRGFYYEGWNPSGKPLKVRHKEDFLAMIEQEFRNDADVDSEQAAQAVFKVLNKHVTDGEVQVVREVLPTEIRELWP